MNINTIVVTRNGSCHVRTLHTLMNFNIICMKNNINQNITFVNDDPFEKASLIMKKLKLCDRLIFLEYSISVDTDSLPKLLEKYESGYHCLVFPCVKPGIDWDMFKKKVQANDNVDEPYEQMGLEFDTEVGQKIGDKLYRITKTSPKCWGVDTKAVIKALRDKKGGGEGLKLPAQMHEIFDKFLARGIKIYAYTDAQVTITYPHECLGNILESVGISRKK